MADNVEIKSTMTVSCNNISNAGVTSSFDIGSGINKDPARIFFLTKYIEYCKRGHVGKLNKIFTEQMVKKANHLLRFLELGYKKPTINDFKNLEGYKALSSAEKEELERVINFICNGVKDREPTLFDLDIGVVHWDNLAPADPLFLKNYKPTITTIDETSAETQNKKIESTLVDLIYVGGTRYKKEGSDEEDYDYIVTGSCHCVIDRVEETNGTNYFPTLLPIDRLDNINVSCKFIASKSVNKADMGMLLGVDENSIKLDTSNTCYEVAVAKVCKDGQLSSHSTEMILFGEKVTVTPVNSGVTTSKEVSITKSYRDIVEHAISEDTYLSGFIFPDAFSSNYTSQCHLYTMCDETLSYSRNRLTSINDCVVDYYTYTSDKGDVTIIKSCNLNDVDKIHITYNDLLTLTYDLGSDLTLPDDYSVITENNINSIVCKFNPKFKLFARLTNSSDPFVPFEQLNLYPKDHNPDFIAFKDTKKYFFISDIEVPLAFLKYTTFKLNNYITLNNSYIKATSEYDSSAIRNSKYGSPTIANLPYKKAKLTFILPIDSSIKNYASNFQYGSLSRKGLWITYREVTNQYLFFNLCSYLVDYVPMFSNETVNISEVKNKYYEMWSPILSFVKPSRMAANPHTVFVIGTNSYPFTYKNKYDFGSKPLSDDAWYVQRPSPVLTSPTHNSKPEASRNLKITKNIRINAHRQAPTVIVLPIHLDDEVWYPSWDSSINDFNHYLVEKDNTNQFIPFTYSFTVSPKNKKIAGYIMNGKTYLPDDEEVILPNNNNTEYPHKLNQNVSGIILEYTSYVNEDDIQLDNYLISYSLLPTYKKSSREVKIKFINYCVKETNWDSLLTYTEADNNSIITEANQKVLERTNWVYYNIHKFSRSYYEIIREMLEKKYETILKKLDFDPLSYAFKYSNDIKYSPENKYPKDLYSLGMSLEPLKYKTKDEKGNIIEVTRENKFIVKPHTFPFKDSLFYYKQGGTEQIIDPTADTDYYQAIENPIWGGLSSTGRGQYLAVGRTLVNGKTNPSPIIPNTYLLTGTNIWGKLFLKTQSKDINGSITELPEEQKEALKFSWATDGEKYYLFEYFLMFIEWANKVKDMRKAIKEKLNVGKNCTINIPMVINSNEFFALEHLYSFTAEIREVSSTSPIKKFTKDEQPKSYTPPSEKYKLEMINGTSFTITEVKSKLEISVTTSSFGFTQYAQAILGDTDNGKYDGDWRGGRTNQDDPLGRDNYAESAFVPLNYGILRNAPPYYRLQLAYQSIKLYNLPTTIRAEENPSIWKKIGYSILAVVVCIVAVVATLVTLGAALPASGALTATAIVAIIGASLAIGGALVTCFATLAGIWGWLPSDVIATLQTIGTVMGAVGSVFTAGSAVMQATGTVAIVATSMSAAASLINVGVVATNLAIEINYQNEMKELEEDVKDFQKALETRVNSLNELERALASNSSLLPPSLTLAILGVKRIEDGVVEKPDSFFNRTKNIDQNLSRYITMPFDTTENFVSMTLALY